MANATPTNPHPRPDDLFTDRERWYQTEAPAHVPDAVWENLSTAQAQRIVTLMVAPRSRGSARERAMTAQTETARQQPSIEPLAREAATYKLLIRHGNALRVPDETVLYACGRARDALHEGHSAHRAVRIGRRVIEKRSRAPVVT